MGFDQLVARLERETVARVAAIEERARVELDALAAERDRIAGAAREEELSRRRRARRARLDRELAQERRQAQASVLAARHALLARVLSRAGALLERAADDPAYLDELEARTREALRFVDDRPVTVRCRPELAARLEGPLGGAPAITFERDVTCPVGVRITAHDGSVEIDDTLAVRLARVAVELGPSLLAEVEA